MEPTDGDLRELADRILGMREDAVRQRRLLAIELGRPGEVIDEFSLAATTDLMNTMSVEPLVTAHISVGNHGEARKILSAHREALERLLTHFRQAADVHRSLMSLARRRYRDDYRRSAFAFAASVGGRASANDTSNLGRRAGLTFALWR